MPINALAKGHQKVELVKLGYAIDYKEKNLEYILDRVNGLEYNISDLEKPSRLESVLLSKNVDIVFPKRNQIVKVAARPRMETRDASLRAAGVERKANTFRLYEFFGLRSEAQAKEK